MKSGNKPCTNKKKSGSNYCGTHKNYESNSLETESWTKDGVEYRVDENDYVYDDRNELIGKKIDDEIDKNITMEDLNFLKINIETE